MSRNLFERELGTSLRAVGSSLFVYKFHDGVYNSRPGDFFIMIGGHGAVIEAKMTDKRVLRFSEWSAIQRVHAAIIEAAGGQYWLVVNWRGVNTRRGVTAAYRGKSLLARGDLNRGSLMYEDIDNLAIEPLPHGRWYVDTFLDLVVASGAVKYARAQMPDVI